MTSQLAYRDYAVTDSDAALLERLRSGDSTAFDELFLPHYAAVYRVLYRVVGNAQEAEDLAQETFTALYRQPPPVDGPSALGGWLYRVAVNRAYNALRSTQRSQRRLGWVVEVEQQSDPQDEYVRREERERVRAALARLPERTAKLLLLRYAGLSYAEIAGALDLAPASVGTLLARAERAFAAAYSQLHPAEAGATVNFSFHRGRYSVSRYWFACSRVVTPATRSPLTKRSCAVSKLRSTRPFACGLWAAIQPTPSSSKARPICVLGVSPLRCLL